MDWVNNKDRLSGMCVVIPLCLIILSATVSIAEETNPTAEDPIFGGQILSLTAKKEKLTPSNDPRFQVLQDKVVVDLKENLMWKKLDSYQELKKWMNWCY